MDKVQKRFLIKSIALEEKSVTRDIDELQAAHVSLFQNYCLYFSSDKKFFQWCELINIGHQSFKKPIPILSDSFAIDFSQILKIFNFSRSDRKNSLPVSPGFRLCLPPTEPQREETLSCLRAARQQTALALDATLQVVTLYNLAILITTDIALNDGSSKSTALQISKLLRI
jgi:hypothetical protein